jgi:hypothetical protein
MVKGDAGEEAGKGWERTWGPGSNNWEYGEDGLISCTAFSQCAWSVDRACKAQMCDNLRPVGQTGLPSKSFCLSFFLLISAAMSQKTDSACLADTVVKKLYSEVSAWGLQAILKEPA